MKTIMIESETRPLKAKFQFAILSSIGLFAALAAVYWGYRALVGWPATPMTVSMADNLFAHGVRPGQSIDDVEKWLASQGIPERRGLFAENTCYSVQHGGEGAIGHGWWMDCRGNQTVAECAGLKVDDVRSLISVVYPEADRFLFGVTQITVYLFFDEKGLLIGHWVDEFHIMP
jgi:hypothetical protein